LETGYKINELPGFSIFTMAIENNEVPQVGSDAQGSANVGSDSLANLDISDIQSLNSAGTDSSEGVVGDVAITGGNCSTGIWRSTSDAGFQDQASLCARQNNFAPLHEGKLGANFAAMNA
jgi:hypothetical protein